MRSLLCPICTNMCIGPVSLANQTLPDRSVVEGDSFNVTYTITDPGNPAVSLPPTWIFNGAALLEILLSPSLKMGCSL